MPMLKQKAKKKKITVIEEFKGHRELWVVLKTHPRRELVMAAWILAWCGFLPIPGRRLLSRVAAALLKGGGQEKAQDFVSSVSWHVFIHRWFCLLLLLVKDLFRKDHFFFPIYTLIIEIILIKTKSRQRYVPATWEYVLRCHLFYSL